MLFASDNVLRQNFDKTANKEHLAPIGQFISIIGDAIDQSLKFYDRQVDRPRELGDPKCKSLKVTFKEDHLSVKYMVDFSDLIEILGAIPFEMLMGGIDFTLFFQHLNDLTEDQFYTTFSLDDLDGTVECETKFYVDGLLDYAKKLPQTQKLF